MEPSQAQRSLEGSWEAEPSSSSCPSPCAWVPRPCYLREPCAPPPFERAPPALPLRVPCPFHGRSRRGAALVALFVAEDARADSSTSTVRGADATITSPSGDFARRRACDSERRGSNESGLRSSEDLDFGAGYLIYSFPYLNLNPSGSAPPKRQVSASDIFSLCTFAQVSLPT